MWTVELVVMGAMIAFNSVFAAYEIALASTGMARLDTLAKRRQRGAAAALRMKQGMEKSLAVVQLGITLVGAVAAATGGAGAEATIEPLLLRVGLSGATAQFVAIGLVVLPLTVVTIIFGELLPKVFALRNREWVCLRLSPEMEWFALVAWPVVWVLENSVSFIMSWAERRWKPSEPRTTSEESTLQELRAVAALARTSRLIGHREEGIIVSAARLSITRLRSMMLPADAITLLAADDTLLDALVTAHKDMHSRFPVTEERGNPQRIIGYINFKDLVSALRTAAGTSSVRTVLRPMPDFDADASVASCLEGLIRQHNHIALVREKDGTVLGIVTMEDILEELVGEIHDEYDRLPGYVTPAGTGWIVGGGTTLTQFQKVTGIDLPPPGDRPVHTVGEWVASSLGHPPTGGEQIRVDSLSVTVRKVRRQLVQEAQVVRTGGAEEKRGE